MKTLIYEIIAAAGAIDAAGVKVLKPFGLTPMTFNILNVLSDGALSQREISDQIIVAASSITFQVKQLKKKGLIQRKRSDARTWRVFLTPVGAETRRRAEQQMDKVMGRIRIEPGSVANAQATLKTLRDQLPHLIQEKDAS
ncbi:MAG: MarR family transcriptional regulator [Opitutaceae bacterium]|jgi:DNA-binding MarR family transcriptional regulator